MQTASDDLVGARFVRGTRSAQRIVDLVLFCEMAKSSYNVGNVVMLACNICLPTIMYNDIVDALARTKSKMVLDKDSLSRLRLRVDVASMLWHRCPNWPRTGQNVGKYSVWDSSPQ